MKGRLSGGLLLSALIHLGLYGAVLGLIAWREARAEFRTDIDLAGAPLLTLETRSVTPPEPWVLAPKAVRPPPAPPTPTPEPEASARMSRQPSWVGGLITEDDYPPDMRRERKEGMVVAELLIDDLGNVKKVSLVQKSEEPFNQVVLDRLKDAKFRPALDPYGQPMNCRVRVPIGFKLH